MTDPAPAIDATAEEIPADADAVDVAEHMPPISSSTAVVRRERRNEVIRPLNADDVAESFDEYQRLLPRLLNDSDYQAAEAGKRFVKKSGWRKIATAFDLDIQILVEEVERDADGHILRAKTTARATAPSGRVMDGDGYCTIDEFTGRRARNPKLENDLRGTAATRAKNRAISDLVGMGEVSAEEVNTGLASPTDLPAWALEASGDRKRQLVDTLGRLGVAPDQAKQIGGAIKSKYGYVPDVVVAFSKVIVSALEQTAATVHDETSAAEGGASPAVPPADAPVSAAAPPSSPGGGGTGTTGAVQGVLDGPPSGSVAMPALTGQPAQDIARLREAGCLCESPLQANDSEQHRDERCPIAGHGLPY